MQNEDKWSVKDVEAPSDLEDFMSSSRGVRVVPDSSFREKEITVHQPETYRFVKWIRFNDPLLDVSAVDAPVVDLHSNDFWMPLVYLACDVGLPIYLNLVSSYLYDMTRGALKHDKQTVHLKAIYRDNAAKRSREFTYSGSVEGLREVVGLLGSDATLDKQ